MLDGPQRSRPFRSLREDSRCASDWQCRASCEAYRELENQEELEEPEKWAAYHFRWKADDRPERLPAHFQHTNWFLSHGIEVQLRSGWTPHTNMIKENPNSEKFTQRILFGFCGPNALFHTCGKKNSSHFPHIEIYCQERLAIFPHILWCEERVSSHFPSPSSISSHFACVELATTNFLTFFHTVVRAGKSNEKFLTFFQCVEFRQTLFSLHQFHTCGKFLTFSSHFLTLKFHRHANPHIFNCKEIEYSHYQRPSKKKQNPHNNPEQVAIIPHIFQCEKSFLHIFQCEEGICLHFLMWRKDFLTFSNVRKSFPHIGKCEERISSHFECVELAKINFLTFFHTLVGAGKIKRKIPHIFPMCGISANALFLTSIPHMRKIPHFFLTFSWHFPHIEIS